MSETNDFLYLERRDPSRNMARFYALAIECDLFGGFLAVRRWGRIGTFGREMAAACMSKQEALAEVERLALSKRRRGYVERGVPAKLPSGNSDDADRSLS